MKASLNPDRRIIGLLAMIVAAALMVTGCGTGKTAGSSSASSVAVNGEASDGTPEESAADGESIAASDLEGEIGGSSKAQSGSKASAAASKSNSKEVPGVLNKTSFDFGVTGLPGSRSKELLENPDRGFRHEVYVNASNGRWYPNSTTGKSAIEHTQTALNMYFADSPQLAQVYVYLIDYADKDLDQKALNNIQSYIDFLKSKKIRMLFRVCYEWDERLSGSDMKGPTTAQILRHLEQLKPLIAKNKDNIFVVQAGIIGLWGEWHHSAKVPPSDYKKVLEAIIDTMPQELFVQVRMVDYKNLLDKNDPRRKRVGYHDDYLVGFPHAWNTGLVPGTDQYDQQTAESPLLMTDGEMPWGSDTAVVKQVDSMLMAQRLSLHCFSSLSLAHNYMEGGSFSMVQWKSDSADKGRLSAKKLPFAESWFKDESGKVVDRSMFGYIRDHLGYYLEASNVKASISGGNIKVNLNLTNYGFSAPYTMKNPELVILDKNGKQVSSTKLCDVGQLLTKKKVSAEKSLKLPADPYGCQVALRFVNPAGTPARLANDIAFENGYNILGVLKN